MIDDEKRLERFDNLVEDIFGEFVDDFCKRCVANGFCNGNCCFEQLKDMFQGVITDQPEEV